MFNLVEEVQNNNLIYLDKELLSHKCENSFKFKNHYFSNKISLIKKDLDKISSKIFSELIIKGDVEKENLNDDIYEVCNALILHTLYLNEKSEDIIYNFNQLKLENIDEDIKTFLDKTYKKFDKLYNKNDDVEAYIIGQFALDIDGSERMICPCCKEEIKENENSYNCTCGLKIQKRMFGYDIPTLQIKKLLKTGKTNTINNFCSPKTNKLFSGSLVLKDKEIIVNFEK